MSDLTPKQTEALLALLDAHPNDVPVKAKPMPVQRGPWIQSAVATALENKRLIWRRGYGTIAGPARLSDSGLVEARAIASSRIAK